MRKDLLQSTSTVSVDNLADGQVIALLQEHHKKMHEYSPPESIHALDTNKFYNPALTFWSAREAGELLGCGALYALSDTSGEIKAMKTSDTHLRKGVAKSILNEIILESGQRGYTRLYLETGTHAAFLPAISLYKTAGFVECAPFGDYNEDPYSVFFVREHQQP